MTEIPTEPHRTAAIDVLHQLRLREADRPRGLRSGHRTSVPLAAEGEGGRRFLLKYYVPAAPDTILPAGARADDYARREVGFYRLLDSVDPGRREIPAPRTVMIGPGDPPQWLLLEWLPLAPGPAEEVLGLDHVFELFARLNAFPTDRLLGRRALPLE
ncbi:MAG: hypothetical protein FJ265_11960, partial [Planctomycetes bacterium]|nr:hypothetical protein [Planctomycetota bacterium]